MDFERLLQPDRINIPRQCVKCGGVMIFKGLGEYQCEDCGELAYDDYGKVRAYIEEHKGATAAQVEEAVGVSQKTIRYLLREGRLEVTEDSRMFLYCDLCHKPIRSGRFCTECETKVHRSMEANQREMARKSFQGYGLGLQGEEGQKRFTRN